MSLRKCLPEWFGQSLHFREKMEKPWVFASDHAYTTGGDGDTILHKIQKYIEDEYPSSEGRGGRGGHGGRGGRRGRGVAEVVAKVAQKDNVLDTVLVSCATIHTNRACTRKGKATDASKGTRT